MDATKRVAYSNQTRGLFPDPSMEGLAAMFSRRFLEAVAGHGTVSLALESLLKSGHVSFGCG